ncbi:N-acetylmuramic acid 6-phosphate etherase [Tsukamurella tyrosinosolvens]|uniref:N-acetylmuramic acid 6-phosphate etherase n=1 Tax=Tsukamurella tyrosinosolvens TaxID=57704 RepID=UPI00079BE3C6|nr:N-acetylmuramic acid 6-phosphate etherase [Tsukamurella tyrosinosolvens]AUN39315.1 N-acetylmuramic acid 6-phosphate etherase [Tsukamurella tyrosinosolvens]KXP02570.1 N-acetylmuramic acid 6-phosphate etherase [Tsukamurella tyrosinosolvens]KZL96708.1 N-acetylmuramic acid 6-phosphate etherase [Tsukamurella tyrosinosolvens]MCA4996617.1 N-acetylmuramic acid 6-phosphate etherase [Tsukamurella tyrosinosolvens]
MHEMATTEGRNSRTMDLDEFTVHELLTAMNDEDRLVPDAVRRVLPAVERTVDLAVSALRSGGRLIYQGAGTSGRLGVLDAAECPPTFGVSPGVVLGVLAGGDAAMFRSEEGAEDSAERGRDDLAALGLTAADVVIGIAASGRTPYVLGGLDYARSVGASTVALSCNPGAAISAHAEVAIEIDNGPEVLTGSTRLKAGTSQKLVLNMISTAAMVRTGKAFSNLMVDVAPSNVKLADRVVRIIGEATGCDEAAARAAADAADGHAKTAIVMILADVDAPTARARLAAADGFVRAAIRSTES